MAAKTTHKFIKHPSHPDRVRSVPAKDYDKWTKAGWKPAKESEVPADAPPPDTPQTTDADKSGKK